MTSMPAPSWWEDVYRTSDVSELPWYTPVLDTDFEQALKQHVPDGCRVLDLGTGPATQAIALAKRGYRVVATDIAAAAITKARHAAGREGVDVDFRVDNILDSKLEDGLVDAIVDRGMFHTVPPDLRTRYVTAVHRILRPGGHLILKAFSDQEPRQEGPYRFSREALRGCFEDAFEVLSLRDALFRGPYTRPPMARIAVFRRREPGRPG